MAKSIKRYAQCLDIVTSMQSKQQYKLTCDLLNSVKQRIIFFPKSMIYALAHLTKLKPTIDSVKCHYIKAGEITQFHQRNQMISENAWQWRIKDGAFGANAPPPLVEEPDF